jgi:hypothetical protein
LPANFISPQQLERSRIVELGKQQRIRESIGADGASTLSTWRDEQQYVLEEQIVAEEKK